MKIKKQYKHIKGFHISEKQKKKLINELILNKPNIKESDIPENVNPKVSLDKINKNADLIGKNLFKVV